MATEAKQRACSSCQPQTTRTIGRASIPMHLAVPSRSAMAGKPHEHLSNVRACATSLRVLSGVCVMASRGALLPLRWIRQLSQYTATAVSLQRKYGL